MVEPLNDRAHSAHSNSDCMLKSKQGNKRSQCALLVDCAGKMSLCDIIVFFYGDDIDFEAGKFDEKITQCDEVNMFEKRTQIMDAAKAADDYLKTTTSFAKGDKCDLLLEELHRNAEGVDLGIWPQASVGEVCFAEGTTLFVSISDIEKGLDNRNVANKVFEEHYFCAKALHDSNDRKNNVNFQNEQLPLEKRATFGNFIVQCPASIETTHVRGTHSELDDGITSEERYEFESTPLGECDVTVGMKQHANVLN